VNTTEKMFSVGELQEEYGDVVGIYLGNKPTIWHHDPIKGNVLLWNILETL